jgi:iron complex outermembrane receptor protein
LIFISPSLFAQNAYDDELLALYGDDEIVSIATGTDKPIRLAPSVASVITADDIKAAGANNLDQVLEMVPGLHVSLSQNRLNSIYSIRGIHTTQNPQVLFLIDGVAMSHPFSSGRINTFRMPVNSIQRIEVIRGPGSAVYGADAFSGVINVITKSGTDIKGGQAGVRAGSFDSRDAWLLAGSEVSGWNLSASLEYSKSDGDDDRIIDDDVQSTVLDVFFPPPSGPASLAPGPMVSNYETITVNFKAISEHWALSLFSWHQEHAGLGAGALALDPYGYVDTSYYSLKAEYKDDFGKNWSTNLISTLSYGKEENYYYLLPAGSIAPIANDGNLTANLDPGSYRTVTFTDGMIGRPAGKGRFYSLEWASFYKGWQDHLLRIAVGGKTDDLDFTEKKNYGPGVLDQGQTEATAKLTDVSGTPYIYSQDENRAVRYVTLQDEWQFANDWELTAGIRYDHYSDFGETINPRLALVWAMDYNLTSKLLYGRAFRAPSNGELYAINNPVLLGNSELDPETIDTLELVFDYRYSYSLGMQLNLFQYKTKDLIDFVVSPQGERIAQNIGEQTGSGAELEVSWKPIEELKVLANFSYQHSTIKESFGNQQIKDETVADAPGQQFYAAVQWQFIPKWLLSTQINFIADRSRPELSDKPEVDDYTLVDVTLRRRAIATNWDAALTVTNLFDENAREPVSADVFSTQASYPLASRGIFAELRYNFAK